MNAGERDSGQGSGTRDHELSVGTSATVRGRTINVQRPPLPLPHPRPTRLQSAPLPIMPAERGRGATHGRWRSLPLSPSPPLPPLPAFTPEAYSMARWCLLDSLGCALAALGAPECVRLLGPVVPGAVLPGGAVPGTAWELDRPGRLQHRRDGPLAGLQRHFPGRRMGPSLRYWGRSWPRPTGSAGGRGSERKGSGTCGGHDQGLRNSRRLSLENALNRVGSTTWLSSAWPARP